MQIIVIAFFIGLAIALFLYGRHKEAQRRQELAAWAGGRGLQFSELKSHSLDTRFPEFDCLRQGDNCYAYNTMEGDWSGRPFFGFDYHYETHSTDSKGRRQTHHHYFSAVILESDILLKPLFIRPEGFFDKIAEFFGYDDIDFESAEFSRKFYVKAQDERWAYDVIHQRTMEFLLSQPTFTLKFDFRRVIAYRGSTFKPFEFEQAADVIRGILDLLPDYVRQE